MPVRIYRQAHWLWQHRIPLLPRLLTITNRIVSSVVLADVPDYALAVGIPARVVQIMAPAEVPDYFAFEKMGAQR